MSTLSTHQGQGRTIPLALCLALLTTLLGLLALLGAPRPTQAQPALTPTATRINLTPSPTPSPTPAASATPISTTTHIVQAGETLTDIAALYGVTVEALMAANGIDDPTLLQIGQQLIIPTADAAPEATPAYSVQPGDTLSSVAWHFNTTPQDLIAANHLLNPGQLYVGQPLRLLGSAKRAPERSGTLITVAEGETPARIALRHHLTVRALLDANGLTSGDYIVAGRRLVIPQEPSADSAPQVLPAPFIAISVAPAPAVQGETFAVRISTAPGITLTGVLSTSQGALPLTFTSSPSGTWALAALHAFTTPGLAPLTLTAHDHAGHATSVTSQVQIVAGDYATQYLELDPDLCTTFFDEATTTAEYALVYSVTVVHTPQKLWQGPFQLPTDGYITSDFGTRRYWNCLPDTLLYHEGLDLGGAVGTPVYAPAAGRVALAQELIVRGNAIILDHGRGVYSGYWHLSRIAVTPGQLVQAGDYLGDVGSTGRSTGAHLHWELRVNGIPVNVLQWTRERIP